MDLVTIAFSFGLGLVVGNNKTRHKLQDFIAQMQKKIDQQNKQKKETTEVKKID